MNLNRRTIIKGGAAAVGAAGLQAAGLPRAWASTSMTIGPMRIETLSDGHLVLPPQFVLGTPPNEEILAVLKAFDRPLDRLEPDCNVTLVRDGDRTILFDVGAGPDWMPTAGKLQEALAAIAVGPDEITHVVFTHAHPDHLWGLLDDFEDPLFANATFLIGKTEWDYWMDPKTLDTIGEARLGFAAGAQRRLGILEDSIGFFRDGEEILPGIAARATFGHTPGHMSFELGSGSESLMILGDAITNPLVGFARPDLPWGADEDAQMAAATRVRLLDQIAHAQMPVIGYHLPTPGIGRAERTDEGFRFVAAQG